MFKKHDNTNFKNGETPLLVFMHENAGNIGLRLPYFKAVIERLGVNVLSMAYRGYSYSDSIKPPDEEGLKIDGDTICKFLNDPIERYEHLKQHINPNLIFL